MNRIFACFVASAVSCCCASAAVKADPVWTLVRSRHFEVYSQQDAGTARATVNWLEQLRAFFDQSSFRFKDARRVRLIGFSSQTAYEEYRLNSGSDAYYLGTDVRDYIVMPMLGPRESAVAAHEYAHAQLRANGLKLPLWLGEGLAEVFATVRIAQDACYLGGELPARVQTLRRNAWMPLRDLLMVRAGRDLAAERGSVELFYAQSWAVTDMLALSGEYAPGFPELLSRLNSGLDSAGALTHVYKKSLDEIAADLRTWVAKRKFTPVRMPGVVLGGIKTETRTLARSESDSVLADLAMVSGKLDRAETLYTELARDENNAEAWAALGTMASRKGDAGLARRDWKRAIDNGLADANLCYRYADLAEDAGVGADEIRPVLERAVRLEPQFDDARYKLALLENNSGRYEAALIQFNAMREISGARAYGYWSAVSYAWNELGRREEAKIAAVKALESAGSAEEREHAKELAYMADTDFAVQFARDAKGGLQLVTTRVPHGAADRNPFVEPDDRIKRVEGRLQTINCGEGKATGVVIKTSEGSLRLAITDPTQVQMQNAPASFQCGEQAATKVIVDYAASSAVDGLGVVRGMEFR